MEHEIRHSDDSFGNGYNYVYYISVVYVGPRFV
jgi:hypothetical protein